jgi:uncharacterized OsmC-like protein
MRQIAYKSSQNGAITSLAACDDSPHTKSTGSPKEADVDRDELRALQAPLKQEYRERPDAAMVTMTAKADLADGISCSVETGRALAVAGLHPAAGGDGSLLCSGDMLLESLAACAGVTLRSVATSLGIEVRGGTISAEGDLDFRGTLAVDKQAPVGFRDIRLRFDLDTDAERASVDRLIELTERYCVVYQTLVKPPSLLVSTHLDQGD